MSRVVDALRRASEGFDARVSQIRDDQWSAPTPCTEWDVRALVRHLVYENLWAPPLLEGQTLEQVGDRFEGDILGKDPKAAWQQAHRAFLGAIQRKGTTEGTVHLSYGQDQKKSYLFQLFVDHLIHSWDLARGTGADDRLDPELVDYCYEKTRDHEDEWKGTGLFGDKIVPAAGADTQTKLLAIFGRRA